MMRPTLLAALLSLCLLASPLAWALEPDEYSLELKGFSPELIEITQTMVDRMEGRFPEPPPSRRMQMIYNVLNNRVVESSQPMGHDTVDRPVFPRKRL